MLVDHTYTKDYIINAASLEKVELIQQLRIKLHPRSMEKVIEVVDEAVASVAAKGGKLILPWACAGSLFGRGSERPHKDIEYVWEKVIEIVGPDKFCRMTVGALLQWRIASRAETKQEDWHAYKTVYDDLDPETGKRITRYEYWLK